jgi:hypothetical protein
MSSGATAVVIVVVVVIIAAIVAAALMARRRGLRQQFGPEYDRAVNEQNNRLRAEAELAGRQRRVRKLDIRPLTEAARTKYAADWTAIQERFVDSPEAAVADAYALVTTVMTERGYPMREDEEMLADLSVEHAQTVGHFRAAQEISGNAATGNATTEDLRQALIHYRALFSDLLGEPGALTAANTTTDPSATGPFTDTGPATTTAGSATTRGPATTGGSAAASGATDPGYPNGQPAPPTAVEADRDDVAVGSAASSQSDPATNYGGAA